MTKGTIHIVFLSLGTNIGNRFQNLELAIKEIDNQCGKISVKSNIFECPALEFNSNNLFLNMCLELKTNLSPKQLIATLQKIEKKLGRKKNIPSQKYIDRIIDIDILYFDDLIIDNKNLQIPHPKLQERRFVLEPLSEIAPLKEHPFIKKNSKFLLNNCTDISKLSVFLENKHA